MSSSGCMSSCVNEQAEIEVPKALSSPSVCDSMFGELQHIFYLRKVCGKSIPILMNYKLALLASLFLGTLLCHHWICHFLDCKHYTDNRCLSMMFPWKTGKPKVECFSTFLIRKAEWLTIAQKKKKKMLSLHPISKYSLDKMISTNVTRNLSPSVKMCPCEQFKFVISIQITNFLLSLAGDWFGFTKKKNCLIFQTYFQNSIYPKTKPKENK